MIEHIEQGTLPAHAKACIALTSWKKRINTVGLTIYNLFETCGPDYHIVLTLAEEEFPKKEQELPRDLVLMNKAGMFEFLWVKKNWKSFKKWIFCSIRFPKVPVISADDDCIYICNYAEQLYTKWSNNDRSSIYTYNFHAPTGIQHGPTTIYPPQCFGEAAVKFLTSKILMTNHDDCYYGMLAKLLNIKIINISNQICYIFHDTNNALSDGAEVPVYKSCMIVWSEIMKMLSKEKRRV